MASAQSHIDVSDHNGVLAITVLDQRLTEEIQVNAWRHQMADAIRSRSPSGVVIDMKNVEYITSIALFPLIATRGVAEDVGTRMVLCNLSATVVKVLTVAQLIVESREHVKHLAVFETLEDAVKTLTG